MKQKRSVIRPVVEGLRQRFGVSVAETDHQDSWQRASIGVAVVAPSAGFAAERMDEVERFLWSRADIEITSADRHWMEIER